MAGDTSPNQPTTTETSEGREYGNLITRSNIGEIFDASFHPQAVDRSDW